MEILQEHHCFGGVQRVYRHASNLIGLAMNFSIYLPPAAVEPTPLLIYLAGLTCNEETFAIKAGAQRMAAQLGLTLVAPDTSPRGAQLPGETARWDLGAGAGFYLDATEPPWSLHYRMESYLVRELLPLLAAHFPLRPDRIGLMGHSMGGHGALTLALRHPGVFRSLSALAPICAPTRCPWGQLAFSSYFGANPALWQAHDASALIAGAGSAPYPAGILIDQGLADPYLEEQLLPQHFEAACHSVGQPLTLRRHAGYDHGYFFIQSFIEDHLQFHAIHLQP